MNGAFSYELTPTWRLRHAGEKSTGPDRCSTGANLITKRHGLPGRVVLGGAGQRCCGARGLVGGWRRREPPRKDPTLGTLSGPEKEGADAVGVLLKDMMAKRKRLGLPRGCTCYYHWDFPSATWRMISRNRCPLHLDDGDGGKGTACRALPTGPVRFRPELIPEPLWNISAAAILGRKSAAWRQIRADALSAAGDACSACGEVTRGGRHMVCDELWDYDEQRGIATLAGVRILCSACDFARHFALAARLGKGPDALATLARVNGISEAEAAALQDQAQAEWERRSRRAWVVRVSGELLRRYPVLGKVDGQGGAPGHGRAKVAAADERAARRQHRQ